MIKLTNAMEKTTVKEISFSKAMGILISTVIATAVGTTFTLLRIAQSDHFAIVSLDTRVAAMEEEIVPRSEFILQIENLGKIIDDGFVMQSQRLERIEKQIDTYFSKGGD